MDITGLDPATAKVAIESQLADVNAILDERETEEDEYIAFKAMKASLQDVLDLVQDKTLAINMITADHENRVVFEGLIRDERQAEQDHNIARELVGLVGHAPNWPRSGQESNFEHQEYWLSDDDCLASYNANASAISKDHITIPGEGQSTFSVNHAYDSVLDTFNKITSGASGPSTQQPGKGKRKANEIEGEDEHVTHTFCSACMDRYARFDVIELDCKRQADVTKHAYCRSCLIDLFKTSLADTTLFPPRCCGISIPVSTCVPFFPPELVKQYEDKQAEFAVPNPLYCSNRFCAQFVKAENIVADIATCLACETKTCALCKNPSHKGLCPEDPTVQQLMDVAGQNRWQRCYRCRTMVELLIGCYHMRCRCGGEFCYLCARPWKTCSCSQWDESRLLSNNQAVDAPASQIAMPEEEEVPEADPALDVLNDLRLRIATVAGGFAINKDEEEPNDGRDSSVGGCIHDWERVYGEHDELEVCGICHQRLRFVNNCTTCGTKVCNRCLNNRL